MNDEILRRKCRELKAFQNTSYKTIAKELEISADSFYSWLRGNYTFSPARSRLLERITTDLQEK